jgi:phage tail tape measure protein, TP901 family
MADGPKLATAYYELIAAAPGAEKQISDMILPAAMGAGREGGKAAGEAIGEGGADGGTKFGSLFGEKLQGAINPTLIAAALGAAAVGVGKALFDIGSEFDSMSDTIRAGTGATGEALEGLEASAKKVATTVPTSFEQAGTTVADLNTRLGLTGDELETVAEQVIAAGDLFGEKLDINKLSSALSAFAIPASETSEVMDELFRVSQATGVSINTLADSSAKAAPTLGNMGFDIEDVASMVGLLDKAGLNSSATIAAMGKGMVALAKDGEAPKDAFTRVVGEIDNLVKSGDQAAALTEAGKIFGTKGAPQFLEALQTGAFNLDTLRDSIGATGDTILGVQEETADGPEKFQIAVNKVKLALQPLAATVFDGVANALDYLTPKMESFISWAQENPELIKGIAIALGVMSAAIFVAAAAQWVMNSALLASPITWIIVGIGLIIAAIVLLITNWDSVKDTLLGAWDAIVNAWGAAWDWIKGFFSGIWDGITEFIAGIPDAISNFLSGAWDTISGLFTQMWDGLVEFITNIPQMIMDGLGTVWDGLGELWSLAWEGIKDVLYGALVGLLFVVIGIPQIIYTFLSELWNDLPAIWESIWNGITSFFSNLWNGFLSTVTSIGSNIVNFATNLWNNLPAIWDNIWNGVKNFFSNAWNGLLNTASDIGNNVVNFVSNLWNSIPGLWDSAWNGIKNLVKNAVTAMYNEAKTEATNMLDWFKDLPNKIKDFFSNAGSWLVDAGKNIINGFLNGLKNAFNQVEDWVGGIGDWIKDHKGPRSYDLRLLVPAGGWIMDGLQTGLKGAMPELERTMRDITNGVKVGFEDPAARTAWKVSRGFNPDVELGPQAPNSVQPVVNITNNYPQKQEDWKTRNDVAQGIALALS